MDLLGQGATDPFSGTWQASVFVGPNRIPAVVQMLVGPSEKQQWYPARVSIQMDTIYQAAYLAIARRDARLFAVNPQVLPQVGRPAPWPSAFAGLAGYWDLTRKANSKGWWTRRDRATIPVKPVTASGNNVYVNPSNVGDSIQSFLEQALRQLDRFERIDVAPWLSPIQERLLQPNPLGGYLGLRDTVSTSKREAEALIRTDQSGSLASLSWNGRLLRDQDVLNKKATVREDWVLDTGVNVVVLFRETPGSARLDGLAGGRTWRSFFDRRADSGALFVVAKIQVGEDSYSQRRFSDKRLSWIGMKQPTTGEKVMGSLISTSKQLTLAIWDDAEEDGDTVSIRLNDQWVAQRLLVRRSPQFFTVNLQPQGNVISVIAENLGGIPPNTSILEVIDGKRRQAFNLDNLRGEQNHLNIYYALDQ